MNNEAKTCQQPFCEGRMIFARTEKACEPGTHPDETGFTIDVYACDECGAEDWD